MRYAELHCISNFTFLRGASSAEELITRAVELGYAALAITDECSVAGVVRAHTALKEIAAKRAESAAAAPPAPLKLIIGAEFALCCGLRFVALARIASATPVCAA